MPTELALVEAMMRLAERRERQQPVLLVSSDRGGRFSEWIDLSEFAGTQVALLPLSAIRREPGDGHLVFVDETSGDVVEVDGELDLADDAIRLALRSAVATPAAEYVQPEFLYDQLPLPEVTHIGDKAALDAVGRRFETAVFWPGESVFHEGTGQFRFAVWELREDICRDRGREWAAIRWDLILDDVTSAVVELGPTPHAYEFFTGLAYNRRQGIIRHRPWGLTLARTPSIELHVENVSGTLSTSGVPIWRWDWTDRQTEPPAPPPE